MYLEIISPDKKLFSGEVSAVTVPGTKGTFQVLNQHAPIISTLKKGMVKVVQEKENLVFDICGGVIEVLKNKVIVLVD